MTLETPDRENDELKMLSSILFYFFHISFVCFELFDMPCEQLFSISVLITLCNTSDANMVN